MASGILQWNIRGLRPHYTELNLMVKTLNVNVLCLQETKLNTNHDFSIKGFSGYHHINENNQIACGGTSIFVRNSLLHKRVQLNTKLQASAVRVTFQKPITICSLYLPPNLNPSLNTLKNLIQQLPPPFVLVGDFNAHNPLWGSATTNTKGKIIEDLILQLDLCLFNDISPTHVNPSNLETSSIDLSICSSNILPDFAWSVLDDLHGSDHYPIILKPNFPIQQSLPDKGNFKRARWTSFVEDCQSQLNEPCSIQFYDQFFNTLMSISDKNIPKLSKTP